KILKSKKYKFYERGDIIKILKSKKYKFYERGDIIKYEIKKTFDYIFYGGSTYSNSCSFKRYRYFT
ncbi:hypothetical protein, partial [Leptotrichia hongkongensis]|uniref:hypothetical protein n=1 Tax=Leptotrichia hongkongensis TaxID=554406 RepID=UPI0035A97F9C